jgi:hypothetical protein
VGLMRSPIRTVGRPPPMITSRLALVTRVSMLLRSSL